MRPKGEERGGGARGDCDKLFIFLPCVFEVKDETTASSFSLALFSTSTCAAIDRGLLEVWSSAPGFCTSFRLRSPCGGLSLRADLRGRLSGKGWTRGVREREKEGKVVFVVNSYNVDASHKCMHTHVCAHTYHRHTATCALVYFFLFPPFRLTFISPPYPPLFFFCSHAIRLACYHT